MPRYEVVGIGRHTGRQRVKIYEVPNEDVAIIAASADGTIVDMSKLRILPDKPATDRQIEYAKIYGIKILDGMSDKELSAQITKAEDEDWPRVDTIKRAKRLKIKIPARITDDRLENLIMDMEDKIEDDKENARESREDVRWQRQMEQTKSVKRFSPGVAALLSFIIPGAGQMYKGQIINGLVWFISVVIGYIFFVPGLILHFCCILGAASSSRK